jgi:hypothetical protein
MRRIPIIVTSLLIALLVPTVCVAGGRASGPSIASFEGGFIDLRDGWGSAAACATDGSSTTCFRTERELDRFLNVSDVHTLSPLAGTFSILSTCSTVLKLYSGTSFSGSVLALGTRFVVHNLSTWGFDNVTSSYQVGACSSTFYDGASAGPPVYPGSTTAGASAASMSAGWDNRVSSVYIS